MDLSLRSQPGLRDPELDVADVSWPSAVGPVAAAARVRAGAVPESVARETAARRAVDRVDDDLAAARACGARLVTPEDPTWPHWAFTAVDHAARPTPRAESRRHQRSSVNAAPQRPGRRHPRRAPGALPAHGPGDVAALSCAGEAGSDRYCFAPASIDYLAGHDREFGAVGAPDSDELSDPAAHCDNADFLEGGYPRTRDQATDSLVACVNHMRTRFGEGVEAAQGLLDDQGQVNPSAVNLQPPCRSHRDSEHRAKCLAMEGLGRALHGTQDFYAHSNWADQADPTRPIGDDNPPGLNQPGPSAVLDLRGETTPSLPAELRPAVSWCGTRFPVSPNAAAGHPCGAQQGPGVDRPRDREDHGPDDAARDGRGQLREGCVRGGRRDPPTVDGFSIGADGALWAGERRAHGLCADAR